jgi:hypothetical protein
MEPDKTAFVADEHVSRSGWHEIPARDFQGEGYWIRVARPIRGPARWALQLCARLLKRSHRSLEVVLSAVRPDGA